MKLAILLFAVAMSGCIASSETIRLKNQAGEVVTCGPYWKFGNANNATDAAHAELRDCVSDFGKQGYQRIP